MKSTAKKIDFKGQYNATIFSNIYRNNAWGGKKGEFYSGTGSHNFYVQGYADVVANFILNNQINTIVEIGCGDFNVSQNILNIVDKAAHDYTYVGYDIVKPLIARNKEMYANDKIKFDYKDSCVGNIKSGDLLIIRQVLQHLNNKSIKQIVDKFKNYKHIIITEHQASERYDDIIPNVDQETGVSIRLRFKSGVYLDKAPFNCTIASKLFTIPQNLYKLEAFINTYLIVNT